jgi:membrane protease YdiL (CAAX protease family)
LELIEYLTAFLLWVVVFTTSSALTSAVAQRHEKASGFVVQASFLTFSIILILLLRIPVNFYPVHLPEAFLGGFLLSLALNLIQKRLRVEAKPPELPEGKVELFFLLLVLAPFGEEALNRWLVEGYLLTAGAFWGAVVFSAALFALPHWTAFKGSSLGKVSAVSGAFLVGLSAGYLFAVTRSLLTAFTFHSAANLAGFVVGTVKEKSDLSREAQKLLTSDHNR